MKQRLRTAIFLSVAMVRCDPIFAQDQTKVASDDIVVTGVRTNTLDLPRLLGAQNAFRAGRQIYAPTSSLYFQLRPAKAAALEGMRLDLRNGGQRVPVPIDAEGRFNLPDLPSGGWELVHNRGADRVAVRALVISAGRTEADRPLGDLRLQCRAAWELAKADRSFFARSGFSAMGGCSSSKFAFWFCGPGQVRSALLEIGTDSREMPLKPDGSAFRAPLGDRNVPNTAMVHVRYN